MQSSDDLIRAVAEALRDEHMPDGDTEWYMADARIAVETLASLGFGDTAAARREAIGQCAEIAFCYVINGNELHPDIPFKDISQWAKNVSHSACQHVAHAIIDLLETQKAPQP